MQLKWLENIATLQGTDASGEAQNTMLTPSHPQGPPKPHEGLPILLIKGPPLEKKRSHLVTPLSSQTNCPQPVLSREVLSQKVRWRGTEGEI